MARHKVTDETRKRVKAMIGFAAPHDIIADSLGVKVPTLERLYAKEIQQGAQAVRLDLMATLHKAAKDDEGRNVTAALKLVEMIDKTESEKEAEKVEAVKAANKIEVITNPLAELCWLSGVMSYRFNDPVELCLADGSPAPQLFVKKPCRKPEDLSSGEVMYPADRIQAMRSVDDRGYKLVLVYPRTKYDYRLINENGQTIEPIAMVPGDDRV
jgi:hypothetical protein